MNKNSLASSFISPSELAGEDSASPVLLALSGGADSAALLHLLAKDSVKKGYRLLAAHLNHGIRGEEADRDEEFCRRTASALGIPFFSEKLDVPALARERGTGLEEEARERRYAFLERIMTENSVKILATAHHASDQTETVLLHALRGAGISGLRGIAPCRPFGKSGELRLVRPLLRAKKEDILTYCRENGIEFVTDSTNSDTAYARNALRELVIPELKRLQPELDTAFLRLSENAAEADDFLNSLARGFLAEHGGKIPLVSFNAEHSALRSRVLALAFEDECGEKLAYTHIKSLVSLAESATPHSELSLPTGRRAVIEDGCLAFTNGKRAHMSAPEFDIPLATGEFCLSDGAIIIIEANPTADAPQSADVILVRGQAADTLPSAHFRPRREGDTIVCGKMTKKVKKLMNEKKLPLRTRASLPILADESGVLWIPGVAISDRLRALCVREDDGNDFFRISVKP